MLNRPGRRTSCSWSEHRRPRDHSGRTRTRHATTRGRWYSTASWQRPTATTVPLETALAQGVIGVDTNAVHVAPHSNSVGEPHRFAYDLTGTAPHRDARLRHALTQLLHWARQTDGGAIVIEDLDFGAERPGGSTGAGDASGS